MSFLQYIQEHETKNKNNSPQITITNTTFSSSEASAQKTTVEESSLEYSNFIYATPMVKKKEYFPTTPQKEKNDSRFPGIKIQGRNLTKVFDSM